MFKPAAISVKKTKVSRLKSGEILSRKVGSAEPPGALPTPIGYFSKSPEPILIRYRYSMPEEIKPHASTVPPATR
jgi:hypothetical protein